MSLETLVLLLAVFAGLLLLALCVVIFLLVRRSSGSPALLSALQQEIGFLHKQLQESRKDESFFRGSLSTQLAEITQTNRMLSEQTAAMNSALRGSTRTQGVWGEVVLDRVLELSGLREHRDYKKQVSINLDDGRRLRPDVLVLLPKNRYVVIDAKVSLSDFARYSASLDSGSADDAALKEHTQSLRQHVQELAKREYQRIHGAQSIEVVLLFLPVENALSAALEKDPNLLSYALESSIVPVTPTTLLLALRIVHHVWEKEEEDSRASEILRRATDLFRKTQAAFGEVEALTQRLNAAAGSAEKLKGLFTNRRSGLLYLSGNLDPSEQELSEPPAES